MSRPSCPPFNPVVIIPSYNTGPLLVKTAAGALRHSAPHPVWVSIDGSTDGSPELLLDLAANSGGQLRVTSHPLNRGKGAAVLEALQCAVAEGATHALTIDADGQHPCDRIPDFIELSREHPRDFLMGRPVFGRDAPLIRIWGRKLTNIITLLETPLSKLGDALFGMRLYPADGMLKAFAQTKFARGFDFDPEIAVRMAWMGHRARQIPVPVRYLRREEGGVSHFNYLRDNALLVFLHLRLLPEFFFYRCAGYFFRIAKDRQPAISPKRESHGSAT